MKKVCFKCSKERPLEHFYKHKGMSDGHLNKCKECTKKDTRERETLLNENPAWIEKERKRSREKYRRLYAEKAPNKDVVRRASRKYSEAYPEKRKATAACRRIIRPKGKHLHHWSYKREHWKDVIPITPKDHAKCHRFLVYDKEEKIYRRSDNNEPLTTREMHEKYIHWCIKNKED